MKSIIRLFKAVPITSKGKKIPSEALLRGTLERGFIFSPEVVANYSESELWQIINLVEKEIGLTGEQMNKSFHKSWAKIRDSSLFDLILEQVCHYITTYGYERLGIYSKDTVYIPDEELEVPDLQGGITLTVIKGYTKEELKEKLLDILASGIALSKETIDDIVIVGLTVGINENEIEKVKNKETKIILYDYMNLVPKDPIEFLRFLIYKSTDKTLLIKNKATIELIKSKQNIDVLKYLVQYRTKYGLEPLAQIFFRFKPLFLAFKTNSNVNHIINRIRKLADVHHVPMPIDYLNEVTSILSSNSPINDSTLKAELAKVNTFRKIRLAYALHYRTKDVNSILYKIRNGKGYAKGFSFENKVGASKALQRVLVSIIQDVSKNVYGKKIYIPENFVYALPATEKQFTGDFPSGTYISIPKDMLFGLYWENVKGHRIDLDLSLLSGTRKMGWDSYYRTGTRDLMFSGDMTDASHGATELFYIATSTPKSLIVMLNYYNFEKDIEVPYKILVAKKNPEESLRMNYMVNPNNVLCTVKSKINIQQKMLGLVTVEPDECRFYFNETSLGKSITSSDNEYTMKSREYLIDYYTNMISLNEILYMAGAVLVTSKELADIDLSPETIEKDTIIKLLK